MSAITLEHVTGTFGPRACVHKKKPTTQFGPTDNNNKEMTNSWMASLFSLPPSLAGSVFSRCSMFREPIAWV